MAIKNTTSASTSIKYSNPVTATDRALLGAEDLAAKYGNIDYDRGAIENIFQGAVGKEYDAKQNEYGRSASQYTNRLAQSQNSYLDAMRKQAALNSVQSGASRGMNAANELSAMLGMSQQTSADATELAHQQRALIDQRAAAEAAATREALTYANQQKLALGTLGANVYATDAQKYVGELGANAQLEAANTAASAQGYAADQGLAGTRYNADQNLAGVDLTSQRNLEGVRYNADQNLAGQDLTSARNLEGTRYNADQNLKGVDLSSGRNLEGTKYSANQSLAGTKVAAAANKAAAATQAAATRAAAASNASAAKYGADAAMKNQWNESVAAVTVTALNKNAAIDDTLTRLYTWVKTPDEAKANSVGKDK